MKEWLETLTDKQIQALACQCKLERWASRDIAHLRQRLLNTKSAEAIYRDTYGKETSVQE